MDAPDFDAIAASSRHGTRARYKHGCRCDDAERWVADRDLTGEIVAVSSIASEAAAMWRPVVDASAPQVC